MQQLVRNEDLAHNKVFLVLASPGTIRQCNVELIRQISGLGYHPVIITLNFPYSVLARMYRDDGIALETVSFIDTVTRNSIGTAQNVPGVVRYVNNPGNMTDLGIALTEVLKELSGKRVCVLYDSVSTMLIYLSSQNISKFIHFVTNKIRLMDISGVFLAVEKGLDPVLMSQLTTFVDEVIETE